LDREKAVNKWARYAVVGAILAATGTMPWLYEGEFVREAETIPLTALCTVYALAALWFIDHRRKEDSEDLELTSPLNLIALLVFWFLAIFGFVFWLEETSHAKVLAFVGMAALVSVWPKYEDPLHTGLMVGAHAMLFQTAVFLAYGL
jgi:hypothetical protein